MHRGCAWSMPPCISPAPHAMRAPNTPPRTSRGPSSATSATSAMTRRCIRTRCRRPSSSRRVSARWASAPNTRWWSTTARGRTSAVRASGGCCAPSGTRRWPFLMAASAHGPQRGTPSPATCRRSLPRTSPQRSRPLAYATSMPCAPTSRHTPNKWWMRVRPAAFRPSKRSRAPACAADTSPTASTCTTRSSCAKTAPCAPRTNCAASWPTHSSTSHAPS